MENKKKFFLLILVLLFITFWFFRFEIVYFLKNFNYFNYQDYYRLKLENEELKNKLAELVSEDKNNDSEKYLEANVYSFYPFSNQSLLIIDKGEKDGLKENLPVLAAPGIFLGRISKVKENKSEVQTIFDPQWRSSVGIGDSKVKALLVGGANPFLDFLDKRNLPQERDKVFNVDVDFPYGLLIGYIEKLELVDKEPWAKAYLEIPYYLSFLDKVLILKDYDN